MWVVTVFVFYLTIYYTFQTILFVFNQHFDEYFPFYCLLTLVPIWVAFCLFCGYDHSKTKYGRGKIIIALILAIISIILFYTWTFVYILVFYKTEYVYEGMGDTEDKYNYRVMSKKNFLIKESLILSVTLGFLIYCLVAACQWRDLANDEDNRNPCSC